ncbi:MAG TPA: NAD-dependent deacylase [Turneriella sp.]|nr:NAD-dependent deacylase [Turneriella sp.]
MPQVHIERAAQILRNAKHPFFLSGAGISAESGVPPFRGPADSHGIAAVSGPEREIPLWSKFRAEDLATPEAFQRDPTMVWDWYNWRKRLIREKEPNAAHFAVRTMAEKLPQLCGVTQNVDTLHQRAGLQSIYEMHGSIFHTRCTACGDTRENKDDVTPETPCTVCAKTALRPHIVWFGEALDAALMEKIYSALSRSDAILVVGTSGHVYPAAGFAIEVRRRGGCVIEINTDANHRAFANDIYIQGKAAEILPQLVALI